MEIITTHTNADLDALASMVAAQRLYPGAVMVFPGPLLRNVEFMALHRTPLNVNQLRRSRIVKSNQVDTKHQED